MIGSITTTTTTTTTSNSKKARTRRIAKCASIATTVSLYGYRRHRWMPLLISLWLISGVFFRQDHHQQHMLPLLLGVDAIGDAETAPGASKKNENNNAFGTSSSVVSSSTPANFIHHGHRLNDHASAEEEQDSKHDHHLVQHLHHPYLRTSSSRTFTPNIKDDDRREDEPQQQEDPAVLFAAPNGERVTAMVTPLSSVSRFMVDTNGMASGDLPKGYVQCKIDRGIELITNLFKGVFGVKNGDDAFHIARDFYYNSSLSSDDQRIIDKGLYGIRNANLENSVQTMIGIFQNVTTYSDISDKIQEPASLFFNFKFLENVLNSGPIAEAKATRRLTSFMTPILGSFQSSIKGCYDDATWNCVDSTTFEYKDVVNHHTRNCSQIAQLDSPDRLKVCKVQQVSENCPFTCGKCCEDDPTFEIDTGNTGYRTCSLASQDITLCENITSCPKSCNTCFSEYLDGNDFKMKGESTQSYDTLKLEGWPRENIDWQVSLISRFTNITFDFPSKKCFRGLEEKEEMEALINSISVEYHATSHAGFKTLEIPSNILASLPSDCIAGTKINIVFPRSAYTFCVEGECNPILCPIIDKSSAKCISQMLHFVPANTAVLFGNNKNCSIVEPEHWKDWVAEHFSSMEMNQRLDPSFYFADPDDDCVSNILEYYGLDLTQLYVDSFGPGGSSNNAQVSGGLFESSTDPNKADTDGDRLGDGYELLFGSPPKTNNDSTQDSDSDGMTDYKEMFFLNSSLYHVDSDLDGFRDEDEMTAGTDAMDTRSVPPSNSEKQLTVTIVMMIGDESGSNSEKWKLHVGDFCVETAFYGKLSMETHQLHEGDYKITLEHMSSRLSTPDYDYTAHIEFEDDENFDISIIDDDKLLGRHVGMSSGTDLTIGRSATLQIRRKGFGSKCLPRTCSSCNKDQGCIWDQASRFCRHFDASSQFFKDDHNDCACAKCENWASANSDLSWIDKLPLCPCTVQEFSNGSFSWLGLSDEQKAQYTDVDWVTDMACNPTWGCDERPEAKGCILSTISDSFIGGQHCCYDTNLEIITSGSKSAGNPHKSHFSMTEEHWINDVKPRYLCCSDCEIEDQCNLFIGGPNGAQGVRDDIRPCLSAP
jgi:hypothetical protein